MATNELRESKRECSLDTGTETIAGLAQLFEFNRDDMNFWFVRVTLSSPYFQPHAMLWLSLDDGRRGKCFYLGQKMSRDGVTINCHCDLIGITNLEKPDGSSDV